MDEMSDSKFITNSDRVVGLGAVLTGMRLALTDAANQREQQARDTLAIAQADQLKSVDNPAFQRDLVTMAAAAQATLDQMDALRQAQSDAVDQLERDLQSLAAASSAGADQPPLPPAISS